MMDLSPPTAMVQIGSTLGSYTVVAPLGAGGMGEVWRVHDPRIDRELAVKVLPPDVVHDPERLRRFQQEARAAGSLNHPNLVTVYELGTESSGLPYIAMELLEGETLREKLQESHRSASIPFRKGIEYAIQLARGLAAAHDKGIVHRDLKPENIFITHDGRVKILDFGLAKLHEEPPEPDEQDRTAHKGTDPGTVLGTAGYMAPEQVRGRSVDHRADIFALGAVLYEMLSGRRAFRGDSSIETLNAILTEDPPDLSGITTLHVPPAVDRMVRRCLEKNPEERFQSAHDIAYALDAMSFSEQSQQHVAVEESPTWKKLLIPAALVMLMILVVAGIVGQRPKAGSGSLATGHVSQLTFDAGIETAPSLSPDGKTFVFVKGGAPQRQIYLQRVDGRSAIPLSSSADHDDHDPMYSPDGSQIVFRSERDGGGIFVMGATGESVRRLTSQGFTPSWSPDGREVYFASEEFTQPTSRSSISSISKVVVATGEVETVLEGDAMHPMVSPNAKRIAFWGLPPEGSGQRDIYTVALTGDPQTIVPATFDLSLDWNPVWEPDGKAILFVSDRGGSMNVWRLAIDEESGQPKGDPEPVTVPAAWAGRISLSRDGSAMVWESKIRTQELWMGTLDETGTTYRMDREPVFSGSMLVRTAEPSPDGGRIAFTSDGIEDVYVLNADGTDLRQLTNDSARDRGVSWAPDGSKVYFYSTRGGTYDVWSIRPDGSGAEQHTAEFGLNYPVVSPDGGSVAGFDIDSGHGHLVPLRDAPVTRAETAILPPLPDGNGFWPTAWSPDGTELLGAAWGRLDLRFFIYSLSDQRYEELDLPAPGRWSSLGGPKFIDRDRLALSLTNGVFVLDRSTGEMIRAADAKAATFSRNGQFVLSEIERQESDVWHMMLGER